MHKRSCTSVGGDSGSHEGKEGNSITSSGENESTGNEDATKANNAPWQYLWKNPTIAPLHYFGGEDSNDNLASKYAVRDGEFCSASAKLSQSEVEHFVLRNKTVSQSDQPVQLRGHRSAEEGRRDDDRIPKYDGWMLHASILAGEDVLLLQVIDSTSNIIRCRRSLRWPSSAHQHRRPGQASSLLLTCITFCRLWPEEKARLQYIEDQQPTRNLPECAGDEEVADAFEAFRMISLSLGMNVDSTAIKKQTNVSQNSMDKKSSQTRVDRRQVPDTNLDSKDVDGNYQEQNAGDNDLFRSDASELTMVCIDKAGKAHFYYIWDLIDAESKSNSSEEKGKHKLQIQRGFASFLLGSDLFSKVQDTILPLANRHVILQLSLLQGNSGAPVSSGREVDQQSKQRDRNYWDLNLLDSTYEPTNAHQRTWENVVTGCITAGVYLVACGSGTVYNRKDGDKRINGEAGGWISFISLKFLTEAKILFLPFAPTAMQPVDNWNGMHLLMVTGTMMRRRDEFNDVTVNEKLRKGNQRMSSAQPVVVAIRIDSGRARIINDLEHRDRLHNYALSPSAGDIGKQVSGRNNLVISSDQHEISRTSGIHGDIVRDAPISNDGNERRERNLYIRRFHVLPVLLDDFVYPSEPAYEHGIQKMLPDASPTTPAFYSGNVECIGVNGGKCSPPALTVVYNARAHIANVDKLATDSLFEEDKNKLETKNFGSFKHSEDGASVRNMSYVAELHSFHSVETVTLGNSNVDERVSLSMVKKILTADKTKLMIRSIRRPGHFASVSSSVCMSIKNTGETSSVGSSACCSGGQGWSLIGSSGDNSNHACFVCWEGATLFGGSYVESRVATDMDRSGCLRFNHSLPLALRHRQFISDGQLYKKLTKASKSTTLESAISSEADIYRGFPDFLRIHDVVSPADDSARSSTKGSITAGSSQSFDEAIAGIMSLPLSCDNMASNIGENFLDYLLENFRLKRTSLLRHCTSWKEVDQEYDCYGSDIDDHIGVLVGVANNGLYSLSFRRTAVASGVACPCERILSWLCCRRKSYGTAGAVALSLLGHIHLSEELLGGSRTLTDDRISEGILDGIMPLGWFDRCAVHNSDIADVESQRGTKVQVCSVTVESLADMTVGCLVQGGRIMSTTLISFLESDPFYGASHAAIMLVAALLDSLVAAFVKGSEKHLKAEAYGNCEDIFWPLMCLMQIAIARDCMKAALLLLNASIPMLLRGEWAPGAELPPHLSPSGLSKELISMIARTSPVAASQLMDLSDRDGNRFWQSLIPIQRLILSMIHVGTTYPFFLQLETRDWALNEVEKFISKAYDLQCEEVRFDDKIHGAGAVPSSWLSTVCMACLSNAGCDWQKMSDAAYLNIRNHLLPGKDPYIAGEDDGLELYVRRKECIRRILGSPEVPPGIDFDLIIPALLILESRSECWTNVTEVGSQDLLNVLCSFAGAKAPFDPLFVFNAGKVMRQCGSMHNVEAVANLVGGMNGMILKCCNALVTSKGLTVQEAETALLNVRITTFRKEKRSSRDIAQHKSLFSLTISHKQILWIMNDRVLSVTRFGDFDATSRKGGVDPVLAAQVCFRTWLLMTNDEKEKEGAMRFLVGWLRQRLNLSQRERPQGKKLVCAVLCRALLWPFDIENQLDRKVTRSSQQTLLASDLSFDAKFLLEIATSCCGLVEALPHIVAKQSLQRG